MSQDSAPPFTRVAIVGIGLIGGSVALGLRERWPSIRVTGVDRQPVLAHATGSGAIERGITAVEELGEVDLVVLATPVRQNAVLLERLARGPRAGKLVVTDVGGTKRDIIKAAHSLDGAPLAFIGGHPIGGAEQGGFGFARPDLFHNRPWIFTPTRTTPVDVLEKLFSLVRGLGARPTTLSAEDHDRLMGFLSHLPQLAASALMDVIGNAARAEGLRLAGRGLVDTTRLASSPASVWTDVCATNADAIAVALDEYINRLRELRASLDRPDDLQGIFNAAGQWRAELMKGRE